MKSIGRALLGLGIFTVVNFGFTPLGTQSASAITPDDIQAGLAIIEATTPLDATNAPRWGNYFTVQNLEKWPPLPFDTLGLPFWDLGDGVFLIDDRDYDYSTIDSGDDSSHSMAMSSASTFTPYTGGGCPPTNGPVSIANTFVVATTNQGVEVVFDIVGGASNVVYDILTTTNFTGTNTLWIWLGQGFTCNTYTFYNQPGVQSYYALRLPTPSLVVKWGDGPTPPSNLTNIVQIGGGLDFGTALRTDGLVLAWGDNMYGETNMTAGLSNVVSLSSSELQTVALKADGTVAQWGLTNAAIPSGLSNVVQVSAGYTHTLALRQDGTIVPWGSDAYGETNVPTLGPVQMVAAGWYHSVALLTNGTVRVWGLNNVSVDGFSVGWNITNVPSGLSNVMAVAAGAFHTLALLQNGTVMAWGAGNGSDTLYNYGQSIVPSGLTNVVAIAAGGFDSMALMSDGTVAAWGETGLAFPLDHVQGIGACANYLMAIRNGEAPPLLEEEPFSEVMIPGSNVTFSVSSVSLGTMHYQWQFDGTPISGATNSTLTLTNVTTAQGGEYTVSVSNSFGTTITSNATFTLLGPPQILSNMPPAPSTNWLTNGQRFTMTVSATDADPTNYPISYQWKFNGTNLAGTVTDSIFIIAQAGTPEGDYTVTATNAEGATNSGAWRIRLMLPGMVAAWGDDTYGQLDRPVTLTNAIGLAAGFHHALAVTDNGSVVAWGSNASGQTTVPSTATNITAVAAGYAHSLAVNSGGSVVGWGDNTYVQTNVPTNVIGAIAVAAGGNQSLALLTNGIVVQWGQTSGSIPPGLSNVTAIACGTNFALALSNSMIIAWGSGPGQSNAPSALTNIVAIAASGTHAIALKSDGNVSVWGSLTNIPSGLSNVTAVAAGESNNAALKNDGTVVVWGDNTYGQTNVIAQLPYVKLIAAGGNFALASLFSSVVQYPVNVANDLLLIYNTNSTDSLTVLNYYLTHRPGASNANVLGIGFTNIVGIGSITNTNTTNYYETIKLTEISNTIFTPIQMWLSTNQTKRPQYVILFPDMPSRVVDTNWDYFPADGSYPAGLIVIQHPSVQVQINSLCVPGWTPFVTSINMNGTNDCVAYINKLASFGTNYSLGKLIISASGGGYGNTNYLFDDALGASANGLLGLMGVTNAGVPLTCVDYDPLTNTVHISAGTNVTGYFTWGYNGFQGSDYYTNVLFHGNSSWYLIETDESFNGRRFNSTQGNFMQWFSGIAFGGSGYLNTPVAAVTHVDEPFGAVNSPNVYFGLWASGKNFAVCAWVSRNTPYFQAVGDPFVSR